MPLLASRLPETCDEMKRVPLAEADKDLLTSVESVSEVSSRTRSSSGIILRMISSSLTISHMEGLSSVSSWQHLVARDRNLLTHSGGYKPIRLSIISEILPDWQAEFTYSNRKCSSYYMCLVFTESKRKTSFLIIQCSLGYGFSNKGSHFFVARIGVSFKGGVNPELKIVYLSHYVFTMFNWLQPCQHFKKNNAKAIDIAFVRQFVS